MRLNAWNTTPTVCRRYSVERGAGEAGDLDAAHVDGAGRRSEERCHRREQGRLAASARTEQQRELARHDVEVELVDGPHRVPAARVLDGQVAQAHVGHQAPPNASAGSVVTARRAPIVLARSPTTTATTIVRRIAPTVISAGNGNPSATR